MGILNRGFELNIKIDDYVCYESQHLNPGEDHEFNYTS